VTTPQTVKLPARAAPPDNESIIQSEIRAAIGGLPDVRIWRNNVSDLAVVNVNSILEYLATGNITEAVRSLKRARRVKSGLAVGSADLIGIVAPYGRLLSIEVKGPKTRITEDQHDWARIIREFGGVSGFARSVDEAMALVDEARMPGSDAAPNLFAFSDAETERVVLGHLLCSPSDITAHELRVEWFQHPVNREIFAELVAQPNPTPTTVVSAIKKRRGVSLSTDMAEILAASATGNLAAEIQTLQERFRTMETHAAFRLAASRLGNGEDRECVMNDLRDELKRVKQ
jgi:hypothetical protein